MGRGNVFVVPNGYRGSIAKKAGWQASVKQHQEKAIILVFGVQMPGFD